MVVSNLRQDSRLPGYMMSPKFLMELEDLPDPAHIVYVDLLDGARISMRNPGWTDAGGNVFLNYTIASLAEALHKSQTTVKSSLRSLEQAGLIRRERQGTCKPNRIYVRVPETESCPREGRKTDCHLDRQQPARQNKEIYKNYQYQEDESL